MSDRAAAGERSFIDVDGVVLHAARRGGRDAPAIVFADPLGTDALGPRARFDTITDAGHIPCVEQPATPPTMSADHLAAAGFR